jgi:hypothetical protein
MTDRSVFLPDSSGATAVCPKRIILRDAPRKPGLHFVLNPADGMCSDFHPHWEFTFRLQLVDLCLFQPGTFDDLCKPQYMNRRAAGVRRWR